jgi:glycine oxidase
MASRSITVAGAGILGLWQALTLARRGHRVRLVEQKASAFADSSSRHAGAMLAPDCEREAAPRLVSELGHQGHAIWKRVYPDLVNLGSLVVANARDLPDLTQYGKRTTGHRQLTAEEIAAIEPAFAGRFATALHFENESHMVTPDAMTFLLEEVRSAGGLVELGREWSHESRAGTGGLTIDCRGLAARHELPALRGVRGERLLVETHEIELSRPVRLLHPRHPIYVVPWSGGRFLVGATMIESEDAGPVTVRSALDLLSTLYALHPAFAEARILETAAGVRPAFPDNVPRAIVKDGGSRIYVNGAYRHGFLLAPVLAEAVADYVEERKAHPLILENSACGAAAVHA